MRFWIDLENTPHVLFFTPIIHELEKRGHETLVTARASGHTIQLLKQRHASFISVGCSSMPNAHRKYFGVLSRIFSLRQVIKDTHFDLAVSHGSRSQIGAAALSRITCITSYDYEFSSKLFVHPFVRRVYVPSILISSKPQVYAASTKFVGYPGLKEHVYLSRFSPDPAVLSYLGIDPHRLLLVLRPPATSAHYHNPLSDQLMNVVLKRLAPLGSRECQCVVLPRDVSQSREYRLTLDGRGPFLVPEDPIDALSLMSFSDAVISGGGTMAREAAVLGIPAYSVFAGRIGAIDKHLATRGLLRMLRSQEDIAAMPLEKSFRKVNRLTCDIDLAVWFADQMIAEAESRASTSIRHGS